MMTKVGISNQCRKGNEHFKFETISKLNVCDFDPSFPHSKIYIRDTAAFITMLCAYIIAKNWK